MQIALRGFRYQAYSAPLPNHRYGSLLFRLPRRISDLGKNAFENCDFLLPLPWRLPARSRFGEGRGEGGGEGRIKLGRFP